MNATQNVLIDTLRKLLIKATLLREQQCQDGGRKFTPSLSAEDPAAKRGGKGGAHGKGAVSTIFLFSENLYFNIYKQEKSLPILKEVTFLVALIHFLRPETPFSKLDQNGWDKKRSNDKCINENSECHDETEEFEFINRHRCKD